MKFLLLTTGGTIAMAQQAEKAVSAFATDAAAFARHLLLADDETLELVNFSQTPSASFDTEYARRLAEFIQMRADHTDGIVITHGTDTMEETAFYLELVLNTPTPVVLTGAMLTANQPGYDGVMNLRDAFKIVRSPSSRGKGVLIGFNKDILSALHAVKAESERANAFASCQTGKIGAINGENVFYYFDPRRHVRLDNRIQGRVALLKLHYDIEVELVEFACKQFDIVIVECLGSGRVPPKLFPVIQQHAQHTLLIFTTRAWSGHLYDTYTTVGSYHSLRGERVIMSPLNSLQSSILGKLCLGNELSYQQMQSTFEHFWD
ncbi:hypothetical protein GF339_01470 [candidate division KSB3 bacterium]|uniref:L-asparaginase n=1 Tax=candidate division KSB3 bacterium TaxID=2044937 RepID=A0A9D5Q408_9BACT|nr:hypothetical protein [candidate division KSB3 bacterium]MBD3323219.1 hypothetical protein [candidate division KSB3 bacterium]